jgi:4-oxalomesaconate tautomerase
VTGVRCMLMRGGTSKGAYFLPTDLPSDPAARDDLLVRVLGSPDPRQVDGIGGGHPLTSKVAVVSTSDSTAADVDYLFLQVGVDEATVSDRQNCGNLLAGVGPFAVERGLVAASPVRIRMVNTDSVAVATFDPPAGPGATVPVMLEFGSAGGALLPTGSRRDEIDGVAVTCVDAGMPVVVLAAADLGLSGYETVAELGADEALRERIQSIRLRAGTLMGHGDVAGATIPKTTLVAPARAGGMLCTRSFIPLRPHDSIGVLGAVSVAAAALLPGTTAHALAVPDEPLRIEHPSGHLDVTVELDGERVRRAGVIRTARTLFDGTAFPRERP